MRSRRRRVLVGERSRDWVEVRERELPKSHSLGSAQNYLPDFMGGAEWRDFLG